MLCVLLCSFVKSIVLWLVPWFNRVILDFSEKALPISVENNDFNEVSYEIFSVRFCVDIGYLRIPNKEYSGTA